MKQHDEEQEGDDYHSVQKLTANLRKEQISRHQQCSIREMTQEQHDRYYDDLRDDSRHKSYRFVVVKRRIRFPLRNLRHRIGSLSLLSLESRANGNGTAYSYMNSQKRQYRLLCMATVNGVPPYLVLWYKGSQRAEV
jgi:hypothetical protein